MPRRSAARSSRRTTRRRKPMGSRVSTRRTAMVRSTRVPRPRMMVSFQPMKRVVTLRYSQMQPLYRLFDGTPRASWYFATNSLYDPDHTQSGAPGHQPFLFDQLSTLYKKYSVLSSTCSCTVVTQGQFVLAGRTEYQDGLADLSVPWSQADMERPGTLTRVCVAGRPATIRLSWNCKRATFTKDDNTGVCGNAGTGSDPAFTDYFSYSASLMTTGGSDQSFGVNLPQAVFHLTYKTLFTDPIRLGAS